MLEVNNLKIEVNDKIIIENLSFVVNKNDKMAIIGEEGNGKSTLIKAIYNLGNVEYAKIDGTINNKGNTLGYLEQSISNSFYNKKAYDYVFNNEEDYYYKVNSLYKVLSDLKLDDNILEKEIKILSGGEKVKIQLLKILLDNPDILLLDEPTNDLDINTLEWLENFINNCSKPIIFVSHDETLLENTANMVLHLEMIKNKSTPKNTVMKIGYKEYVNNRINGINKQTQIARKESQNYKKQQEKLNQIMNRVEHELRSVSPSDPSTGRLLKKKMKSIKSQEKRFENKDLTEIPSFEESINFFFNDVSVPQKKEILHLELDKLEVGNRVLSKNIKLEIYGSEHVVIIGKNGVGKTTLLKYIYNILIKRKDITVGYMPQNYDEVLSSYETPLDYLKLDADKEETSMIRSLMGNMNFTKEEMTNKIINLSGGTKAKLILLKFIIDNVNVLILDEPTRNVSPLSNPVIRGSLKEYKGTIISISHDRKYIEQVCNKKYELTNAGINEIM